MIDTRRFRDFDYLMFFCMFAIFALGVICLYSASFQKGILINKNFVTLQAIWMLVGLFFLSAILSTSYIVLADFAYPLYGISIVLLLAVLVVGQTRYGAQRWLDLGFFDVQPSELAKIGFIFALARHLSVKNSSRYELKDLVVPFLLTGVPFLLILKQPDLGTSLIFLPILLAMLFVWGLRLRHLLVTVVLGAATAPLAWLFLREYQKKRLLVFINPNIDPLGAGYTIIQSKIAIGSGHLFGKGWLAGTQNQLNFLPERHTDFIFSVIGEEWGFIGASLLVLLYFIIITRGLETVEKTNNIFGKLLATGLVVMLGMQVLINIAMTMGFMPVVGLPLPFVSYGGSSLVTSMIVIGILLNIGMNKPVF